MYPFERFNETTKRVLTIAQEEAERGHHSYIGTEHILLALLRVPDSVAGVVLDRLDVDVVGARQITDRTLGEHERIVEQIIPTSRVKTVIELSFAEARGMGDPFVGTEHILLGLLMEGEGIGAHVLNDLGANLDNVRPMIDVVRQEGTAAELRGGVAQRRFASTHTRGLRLVLFENVSDRAEGADPVYVNPVDVVRVDTAGENRTTITLLHRGSAPLTVRGDVHEVARRLVEE